MHKAGKPFVFLNLAMTADGKIATANRGVSSFGSSRDSEHMLELRATADAVLSGARTVDSNPVTMGTGGERYRRLRKRSGLAEYNLRVIASGLGSIDPNAAIFQKRFSPIIILVTEAASKRRIETLRKIAEDVIICGERELDFQSGFRVLRQKWNVKRLLCEGGGELNDGLFRAGVVDELHLTICPKIFGGRNAPTICDGKGFSGLANAQPMKLKSMKKIGEEIFLVFDVKPPEKASKLEFQTPLKVL